LLTFLQTAEAAGLNGGEMHEDILAVLAADKTVALASLNHFTVPVSMLVHCSFFFDVALKLSGSSAGRSRAGLSGDACTAKEL